ncbi:hypothetical protein [Streptomyces sp. CCM_MD2014]|uniref:hypothetical protein n=1 Tax=Streptomyces sp. CCM_MD2014 TaxID=1561022 RepID=UPI00052A7D85|nr:hypothetical protein [Streptomyces sp. CCM_MD2014]AIV35583.1 hypothetical protein NI25_20490 [Streptomyces sp. CCM_MD2014]
MARTITRPQFEALRTAAPVTEWQDLPASHALASLKDRRAVVARRSTVDVLVRLGLVELADGAVSEETGRPWNRIHALTPAGEAIAASLEEGGPLVTLDRIAEAVAAQATTPATPAPAVTPGDVIRPGVTIRKDGRMQWTVERDGHMGVIFDEGGMSRGRWAAWSPFAATRHNIAAFTHNAEEAVDAILATLPARVSTLAKASGHTPADIVDEAGTLADEWASQGPRAVFRTAVIADEAELSGPAALAVLEALAARAAEETAAEAAPVPGEPEWRTLKGVQVPFFLYGEEREGGRFAPAGDRKQVTGQPLRVVRLWMSGDIRYGEDETGRELYLWGAASKFWAAPAR